MWRERGRAPSRPEIELATLPARPEIELATWSRAARLHPEHRPPAWLTLVLACPCLSDAGRAAPLLQARQPSVLHPAAQHLRVPARAEHVRVGRERRSEHPRLERPSIELRRGTISAGARSGAANAALPRGLP